MDPTAITLVSQLITEARSRYGSANVQAVAVEGSVLDETMQQVLTLGGKVSLDRCVVDGVTVLELPEGAAGPVVYLDGFDEPRPLLQSEPE